MTQNKKSIVTIFIFSVALLFALTSCSNLFGSKKDEKIVKLPEGRTVTVEGNTGQQYSGATPHGAQTATSARGFSGDKKDLFAIWVAHRPAYAATVIGAEPLDLAKKIERAACVKGPRLIMALAPCPTGWDYDPKDTVNIGRLAVTSGVWPLKEYLDGKIVHTRIPHPRVPVEAYLKTQGRFAHLFAPRRNEALLAEIQAKVDAYWADAR